MKRSTDLYDLLDRRWDELDNIAKSQLAQKSTRISKKMSREKSKPSCGKSFMVGTLASLTTGD